MDEHLEIRGIIYYHQGDHACERVNLEQKFVDVKLKSRSIEVIDPSNSNGSNLIIFPADSEIKVSVNRKRRVALYLEFEVKEGKNHYHLELSYNNELEEWIQSIYQKKLTIVDQIQTINIAKIFRFKAIYIITSLILSMSFFGYLRSESQISKGDYGLFLIFFFTPTLFIHRYENTLTNKKEILVRKLIKNQLLGDNIVLENQVSNQPFDLYEEWMNKFATKLLSILLPTVLIVNVLFLLLWMPLIINYRILSLLPLLINIYLGNLIRTGDRDL